MTGFEPVTSSLPRKYSTAELHRRTESGRRASNSRPTAWKAVALPTELLPQVILSFVLRTTGALVVYRLNVLALCLSSCAAALHHQDSREACQACRVCIQISQ